MSESLRNDSVKIPMLLRKSSELITLLEQTTLLEITKDKKHMEENITTSCTVNRDIINDNKPL